MKTDFIALSIVGVVYIPKSLHGEPSIEELEAAQKRLIDIITRSMETGRHFEGEVNVAATTILDVDTATELPKTEDTRSTARKTSPQKGRSYNGTHWKQKEKAERDKAARAAARATRAQLKNRK